MQHPLQRETLTISGMSCGHCVAAARRALERLGGVEAESVGIGEATILRDPAVASQEAVADALAEEGYAVTHVAHD